MARDKIKQNDVHILRSVKHDLSIREILDPSALNKILKFRQRQSETEEYLRAVRILV